ncbi:pentatricopeptide repeat-containing protein [Pyrus ussuriensis x Pyrus communis]|uniref:Pentatricopeptide repeat-containing protein n=1 Tax=Pyrus ussuriensis x Pyrus communis TaxID=2448454 RepID=A0A5N5GW83_9ROSA|nr:pentatricopeptide repeat-containing protein [Pyrus ussuriensis x Pyrus communis]
MVVTISNPQNWEKNHFLAFDLMEGINVHAIEAKIAEYQEGNAEQIMINRARKLAAALAASKGHPLQNGSDAVRVGLCEQREVVGQGGGVERKAGRGHLKKPLVAFGFDSSYGNWYVSTRFQNKLMTKSSSSSSSPRCFRHVNVGRACVVNALNWENLIKVSGFPFELSGISELNQRSEETNLSLVEGNPDSRRESEKGFGGPKKESRREKGSKLSSRKSRWVRKLEYLNDSEFDVDYSVINSHLSLEHCNDILRRLERCSDSKTLRFFEWMRSNGKLERNVSAFNLVLRVMGRREDWDTAEKLVQELIVDLGCELNCQVFNTLIYACSKLGRAELGAKWFRKMLEHGIQPNIATFGMLMGLYQKGCNVEEAEFTFSQMRNFGVVCQSANSAMITIYTCLNLYDKAEEIIGLMREDRVRLNLDNWLVMINAYCQQGRVDDAEAVLVSMQEAGFSPNIIAYNTLITGYGKASKMDAANHLFLSIKNAGLEPDETTYRSMIEAKHEDEEGAIRILDDMLTMVCQYSLILGTILQAYEKAGRIDKVPRLLRGSFYQHILVSQTSCSILVMAYVKHWLVNDTMKVLRAKLWKDPPFEDNLYHLLICSCKELGRLEDTFKINKQMPRHRDKLNMHIMCTMIDIYSIMDQFTEAEKLYVELKSSEIVLDMIAYSIAMLPDIYMFHDILRIYQRCGRLDKLKEHYKLLKNGISEIFDEMLQRGFVPNTITFNVMLDVYRKAKLLKKARELFRMAQKWGLVDMISYNTIISAYGQNKDFRSMSSTFQEMQFKGFLVSLEAYNTMLDAYGKECQMERFRGVLQRMKKRTSASDHYTCNIMINIYGEQGWIDEVAGVLTELKECGLGPDLCSYNTLIKAYGIAGMVEDAAHLVKELTENGLEPDKITHINLITALRRNDEYLEAVKWSLWMKQMGL